MASANSGPVNDMPDELLTLDEGISRLETGTAGADIQIDFGEGVIGSVTDDSELDSLLQRARGLRLIKMMAELKPVERPAHMRKDKTALHPAVEEILDALRPAD
jgi:hypothetical protein